MKIRKDRFSQRGTYWLTALIFFCRGAGVLGVNGIGVCLRWLESWLDGVDTRTRLLGVNARLSTISAGREDDCCWLRPSRASTADTSHDAE